MNVHDETDLRAVLGDLASDDGHEPDVAAFRARLRAAFDARAQLDAELEPAGADRLEADVVDLVPLDRRRSLRRNVLVGALAAACVAALAFAAAAVLDSARPDQPPAPSAATVLHDARAMVLPGTVVVSSATGHGPGSVPVPDRQVPAAFEWAAFVECRGAGDVDLGNGAFRTAGGVCAHGGVNGTTVTPTAGRIPVLVDARTSWAVVLVIAPQLRSNGQLITPVDPAFARGSAAGTGTFAAGEGNASFPVATGDARYTVQLVCRGNGVTLPDVRSAPRPDDASLYTHTCFAGRMYQWNEVTLPRGHRVRVLAPDGTSWRVIVTPSA